MIKSKIINYLESEKRLNILQSKIKNERNLKDELSREIISFCKQESKSKINLPDGTSINLHKGNSYQSLTYNYLDTKMKEYNRKTRMNYPVDDFIIFLKDGRENKEFYELIKK